MNELDFDAAVAATLEPQPKAQEARIGFATAMGADGDFEAEMRRVSRTTGVPLETARNLPDDVRKQAKLGAIDFDALAKTAPATAALLADVEKAKIAHDDVENLTAIEKTLGFFRDTGKSAVAGAFGASAGVVGFVQAGTDVLSQYVTGPLAGTVLPQDIGGVMSQGLAKYRRSIEATQKAWAPRGDNILAQGWYSGVASMSQNLLNLPLAIASRDPALALAPMVGQVGGQAYGQARDVGRSVPEALSFGASQAAIEYATERIPVGRLLKDLGGNVGFGKMLARQMAAEVPGEQVATVLQDLNEWAVINPEKPFSDYLAERPSAAAQTLIATLVGTGGQISVIKGADLAIQHVTGRVRQAEQDDARATILDQINQFSSASRVIGRDADTFERFVEQAAEDGPVQDVYLDAEVLMQSGLAEQLAQVSPAVAEQLQAAAETGGQVRIPVGEYAARIAGSEFAQPLLDHLKTAPDGFSRAEAQEYMQSEGAALEAEIQRTLADQDQQDAFRQSAEMVRTNVQMQLDAAARFTPEVNQAYSSLVGNFYATTAARMGLTPEQLFEIHPLRVQEEGVATGGEFEQSQGGAVALDALAREGNNEAIVAKALMDRSGAGAKQLADILVGETIGAEADGLGSIPSLAAVLPHMRRTVLDDPKVLDAVVGSVPVDVVNNLFGSESAAKVALHNEAMDENSPAFDADLVVSGGFGDASSPVGLLVREVALAAAKVARVAIGTRRGLQGGGAAVSADDWQSFRQGRTPSDNARALYNPSTNLITLLRGADLSSFLHESGHAFLEMQSLIAADIAKAGAQSEGEQQLVADTNALLQWFGVRDLDTWMLMPLEEKRAHHEQFARGFEAYLFEGRAPSIELQGIFQRFRAWLVNVYRELKALNVELTDEVRGVMDRMIATDEAIRLAEQGRSMMPLFTSAEEAGMTPDEFAAYQAIGAEATGEAQQALGARGLRDLAWIKNARGREIKRLQKEAAARRAEMQIEARREVMSQPVYRAWAFLTGKLSADDKIEPTQRPKSDPEIVDASVDSLFVAIAKLGGIQREQIESEWGLDKKEKVAPPIFGKHVLRRTDGLSLDDMRTALTQFGYLADESTDGWNPREFEEAFMSELGGSPVYSNAVDPSLLRDARPGEDLNLEGLGAGRLDRAGLAEIGLPQEIIDHLTNLKMTAKNGIHPDLVAQHITAADGSPAFTSGDELARLLAAAQSPREEIDALTDLRMLERYGELATPAAIERAADAAIHNEARARFVTAELNALAQAVGQRKILTTAARDYARALIARQKVRNLRPGQYGAAEARAARNAQEASKAGDLAKAAAEKRNQLINLYAARAAHGAIAEVESAVRYLRKFERAGTRKGLDVDYLEQIDDILDRYDLRASKSLRAIDKTTSLAEWIKRQEDMGLSPAFDAETIEALGRQHYKNLTVEELRGVTDAVRNIEHLGRLKKKLLTAQDAREFTALVEEASESIRDNGGEERPRELEEPAGVMPWLEGLRAQHRKMNSLLRQMDGGKDGGPMWALLGRTMNDAGTREAVMVEQATEKLAALYAPVLKLKGGTHGDLRSIPEIGGSLTRGGRLAVALNWGNETNRKRVMAGDNWSESQVNAILAKLTREEWAFVQGVWDYIDTYWPDVAAKERRVSGVVPEKVEASPFQVTLADGSTLQLAGGYYPVKYDANRDDRAESHQAAEVAKDMLRGAFTRSTTRRGHTKQRVEDVRRPVKKSLDVLTQHISEVTHDLAWHEWLIDANRLLAAKPISNAIREHYGPAVLRTMKDALQGIATADVVPQTKMDQALLYLRANVSRSTMGLSLTTALLQPFGLTQSMVRIGPKHVLRGLARWGGDAARFQNSMEWIGEKSDFMRLRSKTFNRELHEIRNRVSAGHSRARTIYDASLFMLMQKMQLVADVPTWLGQYEKAIDAGLDEDTAIAQADQAVLDAQGGGQTKDMAELQRKHPMLSMFYSYFNVTYNLAAESTARTDFRSPLAVAGWISDMLLLMVIPALAPAAIIALLRGEGDDDPEAWAKKVVEWQAGYLLGTVMGLRETSGIVAGFDYAGPPVGRVVGDLGKLGKQVAQGELDENLGLAALRLFGTATGIPTVQLIRSWRGWQAWEEDDAPPTAILLGPPPKG